MCGGGKVAGGLCQPIWVVIYHQQNSGGNKPPLLEGGVPINSTNEYHTNEFRYLNNSTDLCPQIVVGEA